MVHVKVCIVLVCMYVTCLMSIIHTCISAIILMMIMIYLRKVYEQLIHIAVPFVSPEHSIHNIYIYMYVVYQKVAQFEA